MTNRASSGATELATTIVLKVCFALFYALLYSFIGWSLFVLLSKWFNWTNTDLISALLKISLKRPTAPEVAAAVIIPFILVFFISISVKIWRTDIEPTLTIKSIAKKFSPGIFLKLFSTAETVEARPQLAINMALINQHIIDFESGNKEWTSESLKGKQQYAISIASDSDIEDLKIDIQFPYFVINQEIIEVRKASGGSVKANFTSWSASPTLDLELIGIPRPMSYTVRVHRISPKGILRILFILDKKGSSVRNAPPPGSQIARMMARAKCEFIHGTFIYKKQKFEIYYPIEIRQDQSLFLGPSENKIPPTATYINALGPGGNGMTAEAYTDSGDAHYDNGEYEKALKDYDNAIHLDPQNARPYNNRGILFLKVQQDYSKAISDFSEAVSRNPEVAGYYLNRAMAYTAKGSFDKAIYDYNRLIEIGPRQATIYNERGNAYASKGNNDMAIMDYNKAIELDNNLEAAYNNRGVEYSKMGQYDLAIDDFNKAIRINPEYDGAKHNLKKVLIIKQKN